MPRAHVMPPRRRPAGRRAGPRPLLAGLLAAGFTALGLALGGPAPAAVVTTSGTAVANLHPAVLEAHESAVPLLVLSADRPHRLRYKRI